MSRISRRAFLRSSGTAATIGLLAGCTGGGGGTETATQTATKTATPTEQMTTTSGGATTTTAGGGSSEPIVIGALEPISGPFAPWSTVHRDGLMFAVSQINDNGGVLGGRDLKVEVADTGADPSKADSAFRRLVEQNNAVATTGSVSSDVGLRVAQTAADLKVPHFLQMAGSDQIITKSTQYMFRVGLLPAVKYIQAQASAFADAGYTKIGAVVADYAWGHSCADAIKKGFSQDVQIVVAPVPPSTDFTPYVRKLSPDIEMLIASGHPPGTPGIANAAIDLGYSPDVITGSSAPPQLLFSALKDAVIPKFVHIHNSDPYEQAFTDVGGAFDKSGQHNTEFNTHTAYGYVTGQLIAAGIEKAGSADPTAIANAVRANKVDTLFANPVQYNQYGELDQTIVFFSRLKKEAPPFDSSGQYWYEKLHQSDPIPARVP